MQGLGPQPLAALLLLGGLLYLAVRAGADTRRADEAPSRLAPMRSV